MSEVVGIIYRATNPPVGEEDGAYWMDLDDKKIKKQEGGQEVEVADFNKGGDTSDINFIGTVSAEGDEGLTGVKTLGGYKFTFKKGLLVGFEPA